MYEICIGKKKLQSYSKISDTTTTELQQHHSVVVTVGSYAAH